MIGTSLSPSVETVNAHKEKAAKARLLIVEDDPQMSTGLVLFLESEGYDVTLASDGEVGLQHAVALPSFDLIVLDGKLPERSGFDILREMRMRGVSTPVLMLTGLGSHEDKMRGFELGADDYLTKPFTHDELSARVQAVTPTLVRRQPESRRRRKCRSPDARIEGAERWSTA